MSAIVVNTAHQPDQQPRRANRTGEPRTAPAADQPEPLAEHQPQDFTGRCAQREAEFISCVLG